METISSRQQLVPKLIVVKLSTNTEYPLQRPPTFHLSLPAAPYCTAPYHREPSHPFGI